MTYAQVGAHIVGTEQAPSARQFVAAALRMGAMAVEPVDPDIGVWLVGGCDRLNRALDDDGFFEQRIGAVVIEAEMP